MKRSLICPLALVHIFTGVCYRIEEKMCTGRMISKDTKDAKNAEDTSIKDAKVLELKWSVRLAGNSDRVKYKKKRKKKLRNYHWMSLDHNFLIYQNLH